MTPGLAPSMLLAGAIVVAVSVVFGILTHRIAGIRSLDAFSSGTALVAGIRSWADGPTSSKDSERSDGDGAAAATRTEAPIGEIAECPIGADAIPLGRVIARTELRD